MMRAGLVAAVAVGMVVVGGAPALADAIDGKWCRNDGRRMEIDGATIITPGGTVMQGSYSRHSFLYRVPDREEHGGTERFLRLRGENWVHAFPAGRTDVEPEIWERCTPVS